MDLLLTPTSDPDNHSVTPSQRLSRGRRLRPLQLTWYALIRLTRLCEYVVRLSRNDRISYGLTCRVVELAPRDLCDRRRGCDVFGVRTPDAVSHVVSRLKSSWLCLLKMIYGETELVCSKWELYDQCLSVCLQLGFKG